MGVIYPGMRECILISDNLLLILLKIRANDGESATTTLTLMKVCCSPELPLLSQHNIATESRIRAR